LNNLFAEGDGILNLIKKEVNMSPSIVKSEVHRNWCQLNNEWESFKRLCKTDPGAIIGGPRVASQSYPMDFETNLGLVRGIQILERTGQSLNRAEQCARESEHIGTQVVSELGEQRETLIRARERLDETKNDLSKTHKILRGINRRVVTNKTLLILIILLEIFILGAVIYFKFFKK